MARLTMSERWKKRSPCCEQSARRYPTQSRWIELARLYGDAGREADAQRATMHRLLALTCPE
ncbi:hypothetical protein [Roseiflexus sp.]